MAIHQPTDSVSRLMRTTAPVLAALGGDPSGITPEIAEDLVALLDLAEAEITAETTPPIRTAWDPILSDAEIEKVMPCDADRPVRTPRAAAWERALKRGTRRTAA